MRFILISRHPEGKEVPANDREQNLKDMGEWLGLLKAELAMPIRGGKSVTATKVEEYKGDVGGVLVFSADSLEQAVSLVKKSPGLKYGFTHEVLPEVSMAQAAQEGVRKP